MWLFIDAIQCSEQHPNEMHNEEIKNHLQNPLHWEDVLIRLQDYRFVIYYQG